MLAERGLDFSYKTVRRWFLDEMVVVIAKQRFVLWRAVDCESKVLDFLIQRRRNTKTAEKLMRKLLKKQGITPVVMVTDKLPSYGAAKKKLGLKAV
ncbi:MAG: DDE-type integrase/transposase/recombinase [Geminicoccales bacterium]